MPTTLLSAHLRSLLARAEAAPGEAAPVYSGPAVRRQPAHTVYGGAHLFRADGARRLGDAALHALDEHAPTAHAFADVFGIEDAALAAAVRARVADKLRHEPVEDLRVDFEDGYGPRPGDEEDGHARAVAAAMAAGLAAGTLPAGCGIRIKALDAASGARALRTLDGFASALLAASGGALPPGFCVVLPKVERPAQVAALADALDLLEREARLEPGGIAVELMVETPRALFGADGALALPRLVGAGRGRVRSCHYGPYDFLLALGVAAADQRIDHPACDTARHLAALALAGSGVTLADGPVTRLPVHPHRATEGEPLTDLQRDANARAVREAWAEHARAVRAALRAGIHQGWDVHPAQLVSRWAALFAYYLRRRGEAAARLRAFVGRAAQAVRTGALFDDAATGQALLGFFARGLACGALGEADAEAAGLTRAEIEAGSLAAIVAARRAG
jgi:citrate lyase beta subunit